MPLSFPREIGLRRTLCESRNDFDNYITKVNGKASCYTSLYSFERTEERRSWKMDIESVVMDRAWWDFDMLEGGTIEDVKKDVASLVSKLSGDVRTVFTGRGFHVHQFFDTPLKGTMISRHLDRYQRRMANGLKTLDGVGFPQKLTRVPDTYNPARGRWSVNIDTSEFMRDPLGYNIPDKPQQSLSHLDPFRGEAPKDGFNIRKWIADNPKKEEVYSTAEFNGEIGSAGVIPIPPCLEKAMTHENPKHDVRIALVLHLADNLRWFAHPSTLTSQQRNDCIESIVKFISKLNWRDYNESTTRFHVASLIDYEHIPTKCCVDAGPCWAHDGVRRK
jgi:hypothetical protein|tara:strand:+ start:1151 stop:2149 length:999 start_codon:yes stop_codon:yes gene_type:complete